MKKIFIAFIAVFFISCNGSDNKENISEIIKIDAAQENPCIRCTQEKQNELALCLQRAGNDEVKKAACNKKASEDWVRDCQALCNPSTLGTTTETPRMKCLREAHEAYLTCISGARNAADSSRCHRELVNRLQQCPPPDPTGTVQ